MRKQFLIGILICSTSCSSIRESRADKEARHAAERAAAKRLKAEQMANEPGSVTHRPSWMETDAAANQDKVISKPHQTLRPTEGRGTGRNPSVANASGTGHAKKAAGEPSNEVMEHTLLPAAKAAYERGVALQSRHQVDAASAALVESVKLDPHSPLAFKALEAIAVSRNDHLSEAYADARIQTLKGSWIAATWFRDDIRKDPDVPPDLYIQTGLIIYDADAATLNKILGQQFPDVATARAEARRIGSGYIDEGISALKRPDAAERREKRRKTNAGVLVDEIGATLDEALLIRSRMFIDSGDVGRAQACLDEAIKSNPANAAARLARGCLAIEGGEASAALRDFDAVVAADPANPAATLGRAWALGLLEHWAEADKLFAAAGGALPTSTAVAHAGRAFIAAGTDDLDRYRNERKLALAVPGQPMALRLMAAQLLRHHHVNEAMADYRLALRVSTRNAPAIERATAAALAASPSSDDILHTQGLAHYQAGNPTGALASYQSAITNGARFRRVVLRHGRCVHGDVAVSGSSCELQAGGRRQVFLASSEIGSHPSRLPSWKL